MISHHSSPSLPKPPTGFDIFAPLKHWIDGLEVSDRSFAHLVCKVIPCCCPFERTLTFFGRSFHIPPLCKLNPVYNELVSLRFRSLAYLTDICCEDVSHYLC